MHDFVAIPCPVAGALAGLTELLAHDTGRMVAEAWRADAPVWASAGLDERDLEPRQPIPVTITGPRFRENGAVVHLSWTTHGARLVPSVDADLELASRGPSLSDLQLMGRYRFDEAPPRSAAESSLAHRATVTAIRRLLDAMSIAIQQHPAPTPTGFGVARPPMHG